MKRRLLNVLTALSLLLFAAVCYLWVQGRTGIDGYSRLGERFGWRVYAGAGRVVAMWYFGDERHAMVPRPYVRERLPLGYSTVIDQRHAGARFDFGYGGLRLAHRKAGLSHWTVGVPYWLLCLLTAAAPLAWVTAARRRRLRARRQRRGECLFCGYDLAGNVSGVCPECGRATGSGDEVDRESDATGNGGGVGPP